MTIVGPRPAADGAGATDLGSPGTGLVRRPKVDFVDVLLVGCAVGTGVLTPRLPRGLAIVDFLLLVVAILGASGLLRKNIGGVIFRRLLPWFWLLLVATFLSLFGIGFTLWAVDTSARIFLAPITFCCALVLMSGRPATVTRARLAMIAIGVVASTMVFVSGAALNGRHEATILLNPNYTGHFLVVALILLVGARTLRRWVRVAIFILFLAASARTGSFGSLLMLITAAGYEAWRFGARWPQLARVAGRVAIVLVLAGATAYGVASVSTTDFDVGAGLSSERLDLSAGQRQSLWQIGSQQLPAHPLGMAPGGFKNRVDAFHGRGIELHNDPLAFLVEQGPLGLIAFLGIVVTLWRLTSPGGEARLMLAAFGGACMIRQTFTYRHVWVALAIVVATDLNTRMAARRDAGT